MICNKNYHLCITLYYECLSLTGEIIIKSVGHKIHLETLIAMGKYLQKDLYQSLLEELDLMFENDQNLVGVVDYYCDLRYVIKTKNAVHLPLSKQIDNNLTSLKLDHNDFIPEFTVYLG